MMSRPKQAVIVIHGMGEHRPMDFLRSFVDAAIPPSAKRKGPYSKPDKMSESYELRRFLAPASDDSPQTELYEYYWHHHMRGNRLSHLPPFFGLLLRQWPWNVPRSLLLVWFFGWVTLVALGAAVYHFGAEMVFGDQKALLGALGVSDPLAALLVAVLGIAMTWAVGSFGDVARYVNPHPQNVAARQKIRSEAVNLLRRLHESGRYQRLIVVGHSLGSLIGLDALLYFWNETNQKYGQTTRPVDQERLALLEEAGQRLEVLAQELHSEKLTAQQVQQKHRELQNQRDRFRELQREVWLELRKYQNPWLVTDFVSLGSPLSHGELVFGSKKDPLRALQTRYEQARCPPQWEEGKGYAYPSRAKATRGDRTRLRTLHDAALFACTRWTHIFFPPRFGLFGDLFSGPMSPAFGPGVVDRPVRFKNIRMLVPILPHSLYFKWSATEDAKGTTSPVGALREALDLKSWRWLSDLPYEQKLEAAETEEIRARIAATLAERKKKRAVKAAKKETASPTSTGPTSTVPATTEEAGSNLEAL